MVFLIILLLLVQGSCTQVSTNVRTSFVLERYLPEKYDNEDDDQSAVVVFSDVRHL